MPDNEACLLKSPTHTPWNKGNLIGAKPPLRQGHVWSIRTRLQLERRSRDLALFNLAIDLPTYRKPSGRPAAARPHEDREHCPLSWDRRRRRTRHGATVRCLIYPGRADMLCPFIIDRFGPILLQKSVEASAEQ